MEMGIAGGGGVRLDPEISCADELLVLREALKIGAARHIGDPERWMPSPPSIEGMVDSWKTAAKQRLGFIKEADDE